MTAMKLSARNGTKALFRRSRGVGRAAMFANFSRVLKTSAIERRSAGTRTKSAIRVIRRKRLATMKASKMKRSVGQKNQPSMERI